MATVSNFALRIPPSLMEDVKALATQDAMSVNQFLVQAAAEKVATLKARGYLAERAARATPGDLGRILAKAGNKKADITRFKGLGEMMPKVLWETTLNPRTRRMLRVEIADGLETDRIVSDLMGKDASARFHFIMDGADQAQDLDV